MKLCNHSIEVGFGKGLGVVIGTEETFDVWELENGGNGGSGIEHIDKNIVVVIFGRSGNVENLVPVMADLGFDGSLGSFEKKRGFDFDYVPGSDRIRDGLSCILDFFVFGFGGSIHTFVD